MKTISASFNLFNEGRQYTGNHRKYVLESVQAMIASPATRERIQLREGLGYLGHGRRQILGKLDPGEVEQIRLPSGEMLLVENIPACVTTALTIGDDGTVTHTQELLDTKPGQVAQALNDSKVGGFSWATGGNDGGAFGATRVKSFHGFDYVMNPNFSSNRGYAIFESAEGQGEGLILESLSNMGINRDDAGLYLRNWQLSAVLEMEGLNERLEQSAILESALRDDLQGTQARLAQLEAEFKAREEGRQQILESVLSGLTIAIPKPAVEAIARMSNPEDAKALAMILEKAAKIDLSQLPFGSRKSISVAADFMPMNSGAPAYPDEPLRF